MDARTGYGSAFGTFGELLQGVLPGDDRDFLVTLPIQRFTQAIFTPVPSQATVAVVPEHKQKSRQLAEIILTQFELPRGGVLTLDTDLPEGKGFASSSCDLVATARAIECAFDIQIPLPVLERYMARIEPSDGVMYPGYVFFYHRLVQLGSFLGTLPPLTIVGADEGGEVDTIAFNAIRKPFTASDKLEYRELLDHTIAAFAGADLRTIGHVATRSAMLNQKIRPKRALNDVIALSDELGGLGVANAHSGTVLGILLSPSDPRYADQLATAQARLTALMGNASVYHTLSDPEASLGSFSKRLTAPDTALVTAHSFPLSMP
jgi:L-threonine kinase